MTLPAKQKTAVHSGRRSKDESTNEWQPNHSFSGRQQSYNDLKYRQLLHESRFFGPVADLDFDFQVPAGSSKPVFEADRPYYGVGAGDGEPAEKKESNNGNNMGARSVGARSKMLKSHAGSFFNH